MDSRNTNRTMMETFTKSLRGQLNEDHEQTDEGKLEYIQSALSNLSSDDLHTIYLHVEKLDPNYKG